MEILDWRKGGTQNIARAKAITRIETIEGQVTLTIGDAVYTTTNKYTNTTGWYVGFWAYSGAGASWRDVKVEHINEIVTGSGWNVSSVTDMKGMFCVAKAFDQDIGNWNVSNVTTMQNMFYIAEVFNNGGNSSINNWNVSKVTAMGSMFREAKAFDQPIGNWNVSIVGRMDYMFATNTLFNQDIGNWNVSNVVLFNNMFHS